MTTEILILSLLFLFAINAPIAIAIGGASLLGILIQGNFSLMMVVQKMFGGMDSFHLMAVPLVVSFNPIVAAAVVALANVGAVYLCYRIGRDFFDRRVGLIAAAFFCLSP